MMQTNKTPSDDPQRQLALQVSRSFIVQAPAGSGKTRLLIQRILSLLANVEIPEQILALTFTRKAAHEMRQRVLTALSDPVDEDARTAQLVRQLHAHTPYHQWQLASSPGRLRIMTFDAFNQSLVKRTPLTTDHGVCPEIDEDFEELYARAAEQTLAWVHSNSEHQTAVRDYLIHLDNDYAKAHNLLCQMLAKRDQWLTQVVASRHEQDLHLVLELNLKQQIEGHLAQVRAALAPCFTTVDFQLIAQAIEELKAAQIRHPIVACDQYSQLPAAQTEALPAWIGLTQWLFTRTGEWRKRLDKKQGFPAPSEAKDPLEKARRKQMKLEMAALINRLHVHLDAAQMSLLTEINLLPTKPLAHNDAAFIDSLSQVLLIAVAELKLCFQQSAKVDYIEMTSAAQSCLSQAGVATDLSVALDYRIQHILVDEFQDTSFKQIEMLQQLTTQWQAQDGRSLFFVGDPMQSIYRFRDAQIGLFMYCQRHGLAHLPLETLTLSANYRSGEAVVDFVNQHIGPSFPATQDMSVGAVNYAPSRVARVQTARGSIKWHLNVAQETVSEADHILHIIQQTHSKNPNGTIAILVRARSHLTEILPALKQAQIPYQAVELDRLDTHQLSFDLLALTKALLFPADRLAWFSLLRAPWCGVSLPDLTLLAGSNEVSLRDAVLNTDALLIRATSRLRFKHIQQVLHRAYQHAWQPNLSRWVEGTWVALGGPDCLSSDSEANEAKLFFQTLATTPLANLYEFSKLEHRLAKITLSDPSGSDRPVQIMTIHKAKGLQFETVILPGLARTPRASDHSALILDEVITAGGHANLLMAPLPAKGEQISELYAYLKHREQKRVHLEATRLLYVAATRAQSHLHLCATVNWDEHRQGLKDPPQHSFLSLLWPTQKQQIQALIHASVEKVVTPKDLGLSTPRFRRLSTNGQTRTFASRSIPPLASRTKLEHEAPSPPFDWASDLIRCVGIVVHQQLYRFAQHQIFSNPASMHAELESLNLEHMLRVVGARQTELEAGADLARRALSNCLNDARGLWILSAHHHSKAELALSTLVDHSVRRWVLDRTFVDENEVRWIIDYKVSRHDEGDLEAFLDQEQARYQLQLDAYAQCMRTIDDRPIQLGLYFPLLQAWRSWPYPG